jgi:fructan beta-fructosidase
MRSALLAIAFCLGACPAAARADALYHELYRPQFHFSPPQQWMNDPNGLVYAQGEYHLFYQYNPYSNKWGPMHWGHAVSRDLVRWENLPIALYPDRHGTIFSGSAAVDTANTSGFGTKEHPPLVALFTYHDHLSENLGGTGFESQGLAYSLDNGRNWVKYAENPVLTSPAVRDFRDPKLFWYEPERRWIVVLAVADHVAFYSSPDLKHWRHESDFGQEWGAHGGVWECPDLFATVIDGTGIRKSVLLVSVGKNGPNGGSATQYFIGQFDGHRFALDEDQSQRLGSWSQWLDYGTDDYAGSTWSGDAARDGQQRFIGWMSNWQYAVDVPTERWRGVMTLPRELHLVATVRGLELHSIPARELDTLRSKSLTIAARSGAGTMDLIEPSGVTGGQLELELDLDLRDAGNVELRFSNAMGESTVLRVNRRKGRYELDRSASGSVAFNPAFTALQVAPIPGRGRLLKLRAYIDHSSLEIFLNGGETVFTALVFPAVPYARIELKADQEIELTEGAVHELRSIWR